MTQSAAPSPIPQYFSGYIQDGKIFAQTWEGTQQIGVSFSSYADLRRQHDDLLTITEGYKQRLIELGEIDAPPPTQEQIIAAQAEQLRQGQELLARMAATVEALTKEKVNGLQQPDLNDSRQESKSETDDDASPDRGPRNRTKQTRAA